MAGRDGEARCTTFIFSGHFVPESFAAFVAHRAARLALAAGEAQIDAGRAVVEVAGPAALVDAFEMACSLGPIDCLVAELTRSEAA